jgi:molybdopterin-containing oxidoreductase family iron-sulfur binding subunit
LAAAAINPLPRLISKVGAEDIRVLSRTKWGMLINIDNCTKNCRACMEACRKENNVTLFGDPRIDNYWIRVATIRQKFPNAKARYIPLLCNHCEEPFCVKVCLVKASFKRKDGIVLIDQHRCIGCRYCMIACPYKARSFAFKETHKWSNQDSPKRKHGVVEKCNFCVSRIDKGLAPACVEACPKKAMIFGNLNDSESLIARTIATGKAKRIRPDLGSKPKVYYLGL